MDRSRGNALPGRPLQELTSTLHQENSMKNQLSIAIATASLLAAGAASAQNANMMNGASWGGTWMGGGYGGIWSVLLLVVVVGAVVAWIVNQKKK
jgi:hypothetical protein